MKTIFIGRYNPTEFLTGPEKVAKRIFSEYTKKNKSVFIEYFFDGNKFGIYKKLFGRELISDTGNGTVLRLGLVSLLLILLKHKPAFIHIITYERFAVTAFLYRIFFSFRIIYNVHGIVIHENLNYRKTGKLYYLKDKLCEYIIFKFSDNLLFLSEESVRIAGMYYCFNKVKIKIIPNGTDEIFHIKSIARKFHTRDMLKIVFAGDSGRKEKGFEFLINALNECDFRFKLYATGNTFPVIPEFYSEVPFMDTESYAEFLSDKDVAVSSGIYEPFSISALESMAAGLVTVVSKQTGMERYIISGLNGFVFDYGNTDELISILNYLYSNRNNLEVFSRKSSEIYEMLNWEKVFETYKPLYGNY